MDKTYFATDGSYGDARDLIVLDTTDWTEEEWNEVDGMTDSERYDFAEALEFAIKNQDMVDTVAPTL